MTPNNPYQPTTALPPEPNPPASRFGKWPWYLGAVVVFLIIASAVFRVLTPTVEIPPSPFVSTNYNNSTTDFEQVSYSGPTITPPDRLTVTRATPVTTTVDLTITQLSQQFNLVKGERDTWSSNTHYLSYNPQTNQYTFDEVVPTPPLNPTALSPATATSLASQFVQTYMPGLNLSPLSTEIGYLRSDGSHIEPVPANEANLIMVPFYYLIDNLPVIYEKQTQPFVQVSVTAENPPRVRKLEFYPLYIGWEVVGDKPTLSINEALTNINNNQASILLANLDGPGKLDLSQILSADLTTVNLEYRLDTESGLMYPFYHFGGTAINKENKEVLLELITPAVATE